MRKFVGEGVSGWNFVNSYFIRTRLESKLWSDYEFFTLHSSCRQELVLNDSLKGELLEY
jgi:hypothetical protein